MKAYLCFIIIGFLFLGCATQANYEKRLDSMIGKTESALVTSLGKPGSVHESEGNKHLIYEASWVGGAHGLHVNYYCKTTYLLKDGVIKSWLHAGNNCTSK